MVRTDTRLRRAPDTDAPVIINPDGTTKPTDADALATVTTEVALRRMCDADGWSRVRVLPMGLRWMEGWVPTTALRSFRLDAAGRRTLTDTDIGWQPNSQRDRAAILTIANRILRNDKRCETIDPRSLLVERNGTKQRYTLVCDGPAGSLPISFTAQDAVGRSFAAPVVQLPATVAEPIDKITALDACTDAIRERLQQPRSADFRIFTDTTFDTDGSRARFTVGFTAKNGLGLTLDAIAACTFEGTDLTGAEILPVGR